MKKIIFILIIIFFSACNNKFKLITDETVPAECNVSYNVMQVFVNLQKDSKAKDFTLINESMKPCYSALKQKLCQYEVYGMSDDGKELNQVNSKDLLQYNKYLACKNSK